MANGENARQNGHPGREYWSRRCPDANVGWGKELKSLTHRKERRHADRQLMREIDEAINWLKETDRML